MPKKNNKKSRKKNHTYNSFSKIKGGNFYGSGAYGVIVGDPPVPVIIPDTRPMFSRLKTTIKSKFSKNNNLVSKLFFEDYGISEALKSLDYLKKAAGNKTIEEVFGRYLFLPYKQIDGSYVANIDTEEYRQPKFQDDRYWLKVNPINDDDAKPKTKYREKSKNVKQQIQYLKANCGTLYDFEFGTFKKFKKFLIKFKNVVNGVSLLHSKGLIHHDLKPANILCKTIGLKRSYLISDLDTICPIDKFNMAEFISTDNSNIYRLINHWTYDYFPSCITLLYSYLKSSNGAIISSVPLRFSEVFIDEELENKDNYIAQVQLNFNHLQKNINKIMPGNLKIQEYLREIFMYKCGSYEIEKQIIIESIRDKLFENNAEISLLLSNLRLTSDEIKNILVKYVDIYSLCMSIINMVNMFLAYDNQQNLVISDVEIQYFEKLFLFLYIFMTKEYFKMNIKEFWEKFSMMPMHHINDDRHYLYEVPFTQLYDLILT